MKTYANVWNPSFLMSQLRWLVGAGQWAEASACADQILRIKGYR